MQTVKQKKEKYFSCKLSADSKGNKVGLLTGALGWEDWETVGDCESFGRA